ncbi:MAG: hypothetical protein R2883_07370 [Caldisericia bacterium]
MKVTGIEVLVDVTEEPPIQLNKKKVKEHIDRVLDYRYFTQDTHPSNQFLKFRQQSQRHSETIFHHRDSQK